MGLVFLCALILYLIDRNLKAKKTAAESDMISHDIVSNPIHSESYTYDLGYKSAWIAIQNDSISNEHIQEILITNHIRAEVLLFEPVAGWTILSADELPDLSEEEESLPLLTLLQQLSETFGEVQYFANHRTVEYFAWAKYTNGIMHRVYSYVWGTILDRGQQTNIEKQCFPDYMVEGKLVPDEELVLTIVEEWGLIPEGLILNKAIKAI